MTHTLTRPALTVNAPASPATDPVFAKWCRDELVWLPERGMGFFPVREQPYDAAYFEKYEEYASTELGHAITEARLALVQKHAPRHTRIIDIGIGCGSFAEAAMEAGFDAYGFDVNPAGVAWLKERGAFRDPYHMPFACATFWDVIEHVGDASRILANVSDFVFVTVPIVPGDGPPRPDWRHLRRDEHCLYWTRDGFIAWMAEQDWKCIENNWMESLLGRLDSQTFVFRRVGARNG